MRSDAPTVPRLPRPPRAAIILVAVAALAGPTEALGAPTPTPSRQAPTAVGTLTQLSGPTGCLVDRSAPSAGCTPAAPCAARRPSSARRRSRSAPTGGNVYVASSSSNAIAIFRRNARTGELTQARAPPAASPPRAASGCAKARGLRGPNSVAVSPDGRNVYATSLDERRGRRLPPQPATGALTQASGTGCIAGAAHPRLRRRAARSTARTSSRSAPTARTSTSARSSATRSRSFARDRRRAR